jgi:hypothetical protein
MLAALAFALATQDLDDAENARLHARVAAQPVAVRTFIERRAMCSHFAGEESYDRARRRELERALRDLRCASVERDEVTLRRRFAAGAEALALLDATRGSLAW